MTVDLGKPTGRRWERFAAQVIAAHSGICHLCGHPGATFVDHLVAQTDGGQVWDLANCRPAHGASRRKNPCLICTAAWGGKPVYCNNLRNAYSITRVRRIIAERAMAATGRIPAGLPEWDATPVDRSPGRVW